MFNKNLLSLLFVLFVLGCGGCGKEEVTETAPSSPITWENCSQQTGDHPCDFTLKDQNGDGWNLYDHYGSIIILDFSAEWCYYCQVAASESEAFMVNYEEDNVLYITIMVEDRYGDSPPSAEIIDYWVDYFEISDPVLIGNRSMLDSTGEEGWPVAAWPTFFIIDRDMVLRANIRGYSTSNLMTTVDSMLVEEATN
jgi:thiol-disulfide isomerase/thioredoxin